MLIGTLIGLLSGEVFLRVMPRGMLGKEFRLLNTVYTGREKWEKMLSADPYLGYHYKPDLDVMFPSEGREIRIQTTSYGLGDIGFRDLGAKAPFDLVAIGDSFTFCDDVPAESCWLGHLAKETNLSVATLGVSGYSTLAEGRILERYGSKLNPRIVVLNIFPNDINDNLAFDEWSKSGSEHFWVWRAQKEGRGQSGRWLADHIMLYRMIDGFLRTRGRNNYRYKKDDVDLVFQKWFFHEPGDPGSPDRERGLRMMEDAIRIVRDHAKAMNAQLMVTLIPPKEEVYWDLARQEIDALEDMEVDHHLEPIKQFLATNGIAHCDLLPALVAEANQGRQLYLRLSSHWNDEGNVAGAKALAACLRQGGLVN